MPRRRKLKEKITNKHYKEFLDGEYIKLLTTDDLVKMLDYSLKAPGLTRYKKDEIRAALIIAFYSGARPGEIVELTRENVFYEQDNELLSVYFTTLKKGKSRRLLFSMKNPLIREFYDYAHNGRIILPTQYLFQRLRRGYKLIDPKTGVEYVRRDVALSRAIKICSACVLPGGVPAYYFRHNRFSSMINDRVSVEYIMFAKGSRHISGVNPYLHLSRVAAENISESMSK